MKPVRVEALLVYEEITRADAATGWVLTTCGFAGGIAGAYLDDDAVQSIFGAGMPIIAGSGAPTGQAVPADSGYRLSGQVELRQRHPARHPSAHRRGDH